MDDLFECYHYLLPRWQLSLNNCNITRLNNTEHHNSRQPHSMCPCVYVQHVIKLKKSQTTMMIAKLRSSLTGSATSTTSSKCITKWLNTREKCHSKGSHIEAIAIYEKQLYSFCPSIHNVDLFLRESIAIYLFSWSYNLSMGQACFWIFVKYCLELL